ncbi:MAG: hypothetical protein A2Y58_02270 [Chloroflexi bacterium RBG_13_51_52]|nr:MAG: hypothetical protein A2Y58_02270 [Chloroflexi bacterium RBG_13_51_52]
MISHAGLDGNQFGSPLTIVELGVGSGQQTEFVEKQLASVGISRFKILAYDKSSDQLVLLKERIKKGEISDKVIPVQYNFDGKPLPVESESVDLIYMAWVLHHLSYQQAVINEIARIVRKGARLFMYQVTVDAMKNHPLDEYFPTKYKYDKKRYPSRSRLKQLFINAGFTFKRPHAIRGDDPKLIDRTFLEGIKNTSFDSVLKIIKDNEPRVFAEGVARVEKEVEQSESTGNYRLYVHNRRKVFWGIKL